MINEYVEVVELKLWVRSIWFMPAEVCIEGGLARWQSQAKGYEDSLYSYRYQVQFIFWISIEVCFFLRVIWVF